jgi:hypothetical protein
VPNSFLYSKPSFAVLLQEPSYYKGRENQLRKDTGNPLVLGGENRRLLFKPLLFLEQPYQ